MVWFLLSIILTLHSSLQHEALHGHPFRHPLFNEWLVYPALGLFIAYRRFKFTHLAHHRDESLTDPYDDPESNYLDPDRWYALSKPVRMILRFNNTLLGRMLIGPLIGLITFYHGDLREVLKANRRVINAYVHHILGVIPVAIWTMVVCDMPVWLYLSACYGALSILRIRTFLEHRAFEDVAGRTVIIEDRGILALLFLNNNFHAVHHRHPRLAWYLLPKRYADQQQEFLDTNSHYQYGSYADIFRSYFFTAKDPVPHPLWRKVP